MYAESGLVIDKPLRVLGAQGGEMPVVDGEGKGTVFTVTAPSVEISGLRIRGSGSSYTEEFAGIKATGVHGCRFSGNELEKNTYGIYLADVNGCEITGNRLSSHAASEAASGNGIHLWKSDRIRVEGNRVSGHRDGIYLEFVNDSLISANTSSGNLRYGLHFMFSHRNGFEKNVFSANGSGVAVMYSREIRMIGNTFSGSRGGAAYGILLKDISQGDIRANLFTDNTVGAYIEGTTRSSFSGNVFSANGWAMRVLGNTEGIVFTQNDFLGNTFDVTTNASTSLNTFSGNYWSKYRGLDLDRDGIGDIPYRPVQLSTLLMERHGVLIILIRSFFFSVLDEMESILPVLTPASYRDEHPRMKATVPR
jgi:nitrous oxidase accessory protein